MGNPSAARAVATVALILAAFVASAAAPALTFGLTLAVLGPAHALVELRYVDQRFGAAWGGAARGIGALLLGVVLVKLAPAWPHARAAELTLVAGLAAAAAATGSGRRAAAALPIGVALVVLVAAWAAPAPTLLALAALHNWTPAGLVLERTGPDARVVVALLGVFVALPGALAAGLPEVALARSAAGLEVLGVDAPTAPLRAWLPAGMGDGDAAWRAFSALTFAQCMHYGCVLGVLPTLGPGPAAAPWALGRLPAVHARAAVLVVGAGAAAAFAVDFDGTRGLYGVLAAVHAWIEVPALLLAVTSRWRTG